MLVDVVRMRSAGHRLSAEALAQATPVRGELSMTTKPWSDPRERLARQELTMFAAVMPSDGTSAQPLLPLLVRAYVHEVKGNSMSVAGEEADPSNAVGYVKQTWWCRLVLD